jgi:predicted DNA-binding transcriptional regulator AlpA
MNRNQTSPTTPSVDVQDTRPIRILRLWQVQATVGLSRVTIYQVIREGRFAKPVKIYQRTGQRVVGLRKGLPFGIRLTDNVQCRRA